MRMVHKSGDKIIVKVIMNGHACLGEDKHYYSVPYQYIGKKIKILYSQNTVEIFYKRPLHIK